MCKKRKWKVLVFIVVAGGIIVYFLQQEWAHREEPFLKNSQVECVSLLGWFTKEDRLKNDRIELVELRPGDILVTLSTHSLGWRHGHAGLVVDEDTVLECVTWGRNSMLVDAEHWETYSTVAVLRVRDASDEVCKNVVEYAMENLLDVPYHLTAGFLGQKDPNVEEEYFGLQCSYLVWYAWNRFGYDLDSDGERLVSSYDLLQSEHLEVVQIYGMERKE